MAISVIIRNGNVTNLESSFNVSVSTSDDYQVHEELCPLTQYKIYPSSPCLDCKVCNHREVETRGCGPHLNRVCEPMIQVSADALGSSNLDLSLYSTLLSDLNASLVGSKAGLEIFIEGIDCPPNYFRSPMSQRCILCGTCPPLSLPKTKCSFYQNTTCGPRIEVGVIIKGIDSVDAQVLIGGEIRDATQLIPSLKPCTPNEYRPSPLVVCQRCDVCGALEIEVHPCNSTTNTVCKGKLLVQVDIGNTTFVDWGLLRDYLSRYSVIPGNVSSLSNVDITVTKLICPSEFFLNLTNYLCIPCLDCGPGRFRKYPCGLNTPGSQCRSCTVCNKYSQTCQPNHDAICEGKIGINIDIIGGNLNQSLNGLIQGIVKNASGINEDFIDKNPARADYHNLNGITTNLCPTNAYSTGFECKPCSICDQTAYLEVKCRNFSDTICKPCTQCGLDEYMFSACGGLDTVCYGYPRRNLTMDFTLVALHGPFVMFRDYFPGFLSGLMEQLGGSGLKVTGITAQQLQVSFYSVNNDSYRVPRLNLTLFKISPTVDGVFQYNFSILVYNTISQRFPGYETDPTVVLERSLGHMERVLNLTQDPSPNRRLLGINTCPIDSYPYNYGGDLGIACIPCQDDPVPGSTQSTPPLLRRVLATSTCPQGSMRFCSGNSNPTCDERSSVAALMPNAVLSEGIFSCPANQEPLSLTSNSLEVCFGNPCPPGFSGLAGHCSPCLPGFYKIIYGDSPCVLCPDNMISKGGSETCEACGYGSTPNHNKTICLCLGGFQPPLCEPCLPGMYSDFNEDCKVCPNGTQTHGDRCDLCEEGTAGYNGICLECPGKLYAASRGLTKCLECDPGFYSNDHIDCILCPSGTTGLGCEPCKIGTYEQSKICLSCPDGLSSDSGSSSISACQECPRGTFYSSQNCISCPAQTTSPRGARKITECLAKVGYHAHPGSEGILCPKNHYCPEGSMRPTLCPPGTISDLGQVSCESILESRDPLMDYILIPAWGVTAFLTFVWIFRVRRSFWRRVR